jgi:hypothetical protein
MIKRLFTTPKIGMTLGDGICLLIVGALLFLIVSCCNPDKPAVIVHPFKSYDAELHLRGFDTDCDGKINYWQHYDSFENPVGRKIWVRRK